MKTHSKKLLSQRNYNIAITLLTFATAGFAKAVIKKSWESISSTEPPENPEAKDSKTLDVIAFSVTLGIISALVKVMTRKTFSQGWKKWGGQLPENLD